MDGLRWSVEKPEESRATPTVSVILGVSVFTDDVDRLLLLSLLLLRLGVLLPSQTLLPLPREPAQHPANGRHAGNVRPVAHPFLHQPLPDLPAEHSRVLLLVLLDVGDEVRARPQSRSLLRPSRSHGPRPDTPRLLIALWETKRTFELSGCLATTPSTVTNMAAEHVFNCYFADIIIS